MNNNSVSNLLKVTALGVTLAGCTKHSSTPVVNRFPTCDASATTQQLTFVHVNDLHANYQLDANGVSPYAVLRGFYLATKAENPFTIFTSGGDEYEKGAVAEQMTEGLSTREILHGMNFDVRVLGNHDFGWNENEILEDARDPYSQVL